MNRFVLALFCLIALALPAVAQDDSLASLIQAGNHKAAIEKIRTANAAAVNQAQADGTTPLHWAVYHVDYDLVDALLKKGAKPNVANEFGSTPLAEAVKLNHVRLARLLLGAGANVNAANEDGQTALMLAVRTGDPAIVDALIGSGANVKAIEDWRGQTPLMWAAARSAPEVVKLLIAKGADVHVRAKENDWPSQITSEPRAQYRPTGGLTALLYAARGGCKGCVEALLDGGADVNIAQSGWRDAIDAGDRQRQLRCCEVLVGARRQSGNVGLVGTHGFVHCRGHETSRRRRRSGCKSRDREDAAECRRESKSATQHASTEPRRKQRPVY